jgi:hypothetical protein
MATDLIPDEVEKTLKRRVGPLPLGAWVGVGAVLVAVTVAILRKRRGGGAMPTDNPVEPDTTGGTPIKPVPTEFRAEGSGTGTSAGSGFANTPGFSSPALTTNYEWRGRAETWAIAHGITPTEASAAIARYLSGEALTVQQRAIINAILTAVGPTPEPVPPPMTDPTPGGGQDSPPPSGVGDGGGGGSTAPKPAQGSIRFNGGVGTSQVAGKKYVQQYQGSQWVTLLEQVSGTRYRLWGPIAGGLNPEDMKALIAQMNQYLGPALGITVIP